MFLERAALFTGRVPAARATDGDAPRANQRKHLGRGVSAQPTLRKSGAGVFQGKKSSQPAVKAGGPAPRLPVRARHGCPQVGDELAVLHEPRQLPLVRLPRRLRAPGVVRCKKLSGDLVSPVKFLESHYRSFKSDRVYARCFYPWYG